LLVDVWAGEDVVAPERGGRLQPLCALWSVAALPAARAALGSADRSVAGVVGVLDVRTVAEPEWRARATGPDPLLNVNSPRDFERAAALLATEERSGTARGNP
jgi:molybdopterin-guanine dinucleotide biosynthesis protein A